MYGWRGRLGVIVPSPNTTVEREFGRSLPEGVSAHFSRMDLGDATAENLQQMEDDAEQCADLLAAADVDIVAYACTTGSFVNGMEHDEKIESRLSDVAGVPAITTGASIRRAFDELNVTSVAVATPYLDELNRQLVEFIESNGISVLDLERQQFAESTASGSLFPEVVFRSATSVDTDEADAIFVSCTNYRTFEIIPALEEDCGKPVITSNQATLWDALRTIGVDYSDIELGTLFWG